MIEIRRITRDDPLFAQALRLREQVLLEPLGKDIAWYEQHYADVCQQAEYFVAVFNHPAGERVVGVVLLVPNHPHAGMGKLMQMAVDPQRQGEGIGRKLVVALEMRAFGELGLNQVFCHAQNSAMGFYEKLGWVTDPDEFYEAGIPHHRMWLEQPVSDTTNNA